MNEWTSPDGRIRLLNADCLAVLPELEQGSVDAVVTDPPYGVTDHAWDVPVDERLWMVAKCVVATASEPFATRLINRSELPFAFDCVWVKNCVSNPMNAHRQPMRRHERVLVFGSYCWNPQTRMRTDDELKRLNQEQRRKYPNVMPDSVLEFSSVNNRSGERTSHPSQKPVELMEYLVTSFTNGTILDPFAGSCTTAIACIRQNRRCIAIEKERKYWEIGVQRCKAEYARTVLFNDMEAVA